MSSEIKHDQMVSIGDHDYRVALIGKEGYTITLYKREKPLVTERYELKLSQEQVARMLGVRASSISRVETGFQYMKKLRLRMRALYYRLQKERSQQ